MSKLVNVEVVADKFGNYKKGDKIEKMHPSTAKALGDIVKVIGDYEAPDRGSKVAIAYKGNTKKETKAAIKKGTEKMTAEAKEEAEVEAEIEAEKIKEAQKGMTAEEIEADDIKNGTGKKKTLLDKILGKKD